MTPEPTPSQELREKIDKLLDFFTEPNQGEKYLKDLANDLEQLFTQHELSRKQEWVEAQEKYDELIMAVGNKYAGETRHETALRYIKSCENNYETRAKTIKEQSKE